MRSTKSIILIVVALACGTIAAIGMRQAMARPDTTVDEETETIYVAVSNVPSWSKLNEDLVRPEEWPKARIPQDAARSVEDFDGKSSLYPMYPGEPIIITKLTDGSGTYASDRIPAGHQVFAVKVDKESALSGLIHPGDKVDVLVFVRGRPGVRTGTRTIMRNVTVFAVNDQLARSTEGESGSIDAKTVSLLVQPEQSEKLLLAKQLGTIHLALRKPGDNTSMDTDGAKPSDLDDDATDGSDGGDIADSDDQPGGSIAGTEPTTPSSDIFGLLQGMKRDNSMAVDSINAVVAPAAPASRMVIMSGEGVLGTYTFPQEGYSAGDAGRLPQLPAELMSGFFGGSEGPSSAAAVADPGTVGPLEPESEPSDGSSGGDGDGADSGANGPASTPEADALEILDPADLGL